jgi:hypothetical protein
LTRQHSTPILLTSGVVRAVALTPVGQPGDDLASEADIQALVHAHPECLPIAEIDRMFLGPVPICTELNTQAGPIDNFMVTASGLPVLVECKLWRNPEARREVVGQILDYAKELSRWSSSDLQREVSRRLGRNGNPLLEMVREVDRTVNEIAFNDALTANLRRGRFLLLIVGDGIREGVEAIAEYLQVHAGLHFSLGLVELPMYLMPDGSRLVAPRVLAKTIIVTREVVALPDGYALQEVRDPETDGDEVDPERDALGDAYQAFWKEFLAGLKLDDPEQPIPRPARQGHLSFTLPAPTSWLTVYRDMRRGEVGIGLSYWADTAGESAVKAIVDDWDAVKAELGGSPNLTTRKGRPYISEALTVGQLTDPEVRRRAFEWLRERVNSFINVIRPRARSAAADYEKRGAA